MMISCQDSVWVCVCELEREREREREREYLFITRVNFLSSCILKGIFSLFYIYIYIYIRLRISRGHLIFIESLVLPNIRD
jgi:hypothetical protein